MRGHSANLGSQYEKRLRRIARHLARRHRVTIERVADVLAERLELTGSEIDALMPPAWIARYGIGVRPAAATHFGATNARRVELATKAREYNGLLKEQVQADSDRQRVRQRLDTFLLQRGLHQSQGAEEVATGAASSPGRAGSWYRAPKNNAPAGWKRASMPVRNWARRRSSFRDRTHSGLIAVRETRRGYLPSLGVPRAGGKIGITLMFRPPH